MLKIKNSRFQGYYRSTVFVSALFVKLHRPLPVMSNFFPGARFFQNTVVSKPLAAEVIAANNASGPRTGDRYFSFICKIHSLPQCIKYY